MPSRENPDGSITYYLEGTDPDAGVPGTVSKKAVPAAETKVVDPPVTPEPAATEGAESKAIAPDA